MDFPLSDVVEETLGTFRLWQRPSKNLTGNIAPMISCADEKTIRRSGNYFGTMLLSTPRTRNCSDAGKAKKGRVRLSHQYHRIYSKNLPSICLTVFTVQTVPGIPKPKGMVWDSPLQQLQWKPIKGRLPAVTRTKKVLVD